MLLLAVSFILSLNKTLQSVLFEKKEHVTSQTLLLLYFTGNLTYRCCRKYVEDVILVSDEEILTCMSRLFDIGLKAEPSGCAAMAAILNNKIPDVAGKNVVVLITGSNVTLSEMSSYIK